MDKESYLILFNAITDAREILRKAQEECEERYVKETDIAVISSKTKDTD